MKITSWNVNGIRAIFKKENILAPSLKESASFLLYLKSCGADIFCIQETKSSKEQIPKELTELVPYRFYCSSAQKKGYSGVGVWSKIEPKSVEYGIGEEKFDIEGRILKIEFKNFYLFNIYFPNGGSSPQRLQYKLDFYDFFISYLKQIKNKPVIICGDFNTAHSEIDLARPKENINNTGFMPIERQRLDALVEAGFIDTFRHFNKAGGNFTWWDYKTAARGRNVGWRLDYFFISKAAAQKLQSALIEKDIYGSDHCPVNIETSL